MYTLFETLRFQKVVQKHLLVYGGIFNVHFVEKFVLSLAVKGFCKLVNISRSY